MASCQRDFHQELMPRAYRQILLVGKDQEQSIPQLILIQHTLQFFARFHDTIAIVAVYHEDDALSVLEVMPPKRPDLVLSSHIPYGKLDILVLDSLDIEALYELNRQSCWACLTQTPLDITHQL